MKLPQHVPNIQSSVRRAGGKRIQCWVDISLISIEESEPSGVSADSYTSAELREIYKNNTKNALVREQFDAPDDSDTEIILEDFGDAIEERD